jgi:glutaminase
MINAGAIMVSSLISPNEEPSKRFGTIKNFYQNLSGGVGKIGFDNGVFLSEKHHADRNTSLAYYMRENKAFAGNPTPSQINETLDLYFQCCSVTINTSIGAVIAATLANSGVNPITKLAVIDKNIIRDCLSLMFACGMYDFSGQFAFQIGLPAKSGVSGCLLLVVPNCCGICIWSPRLDKMGNSVRGVEFCKQFVQETKYNYHIFDNFVNQTDLVLSHKKEEDIVILTQRLISAAAEGDLNTVASLEGKVDFGKADYDGRTALHLAASEGHQKIVSFLIGQEVDLNPKDRWGNTPYHEAKKGLKNETNSADKKENFNQICSLIISQNSSVDLESIGSMDQEPRSN